MRIAHTFCCYFSSLYLSQKLKPGVSKLPLVRQDGGKIPLLCLYISKVYPRIFREDDGNRKIDRGELGEELANKNWNEAFERTR